MWAEFEPPLADNCSVVRSIGGTNVLVDNHADVAGGAVFATDKASLNMTCSNGLPLDFVAGCPSPAWSGNTVGCLQPLLGYVAMAHALFVSKWILMVANSLPIVSVHLALCIA